MRKTIYLFPVIFSLLTLMFGCASTIEMASDIKLAVLIGDNMVIQRGEPVKLWGKATPEKMVKVEFLKHKAEVIAGTDSIWQVELGVENAGGPYELVVTGKDTTITLKNVMVGEVWLCSGQSNMEYSLGNPYRNPPANCADEIAAASHPNIRLFYNKKLAKPSPLSEANSTGWDVCSPETVAKFSAVGYFFGRNLHENLDIPIGLIQSAWGGTSIQPWMSKDAFKSFPEYAKRIEDLIIPESYSFKKEMNKYEQRITKYLEENQDKFISPEFKNWTKNDFKISDWKVMELPERWEINAMPKYDGVVLFKKKIVVPKKMTGKDLTIEFGRIDDIDLTYFNEELIGNERIYSTHRKYTIPAKLIKEGENTIAVKVIDLGMAGGFRGSKKNFIISSETDTISIAGEWNYMPIIDVKFLGDFPKYPIGIQHNPTVLYNGMIASLHQFAIRGVIWYQGESNENNAYEYRKLFPALIKDWREKWNIGDFPFLFVQLANFKKINEQPVDDKWAKLRESQLLTLSVPNTGMAVTIDIGETGNIHPSNKLDVGKRLALIARNKIYGENIPYSGPIYKSMKINGNEIELTFNFIEGGLKTTDNETVKGFAIAGENKKFVWADAVIKNNKIVVNSREVPHPVAVRYAWSINPVCNLYNSADLPASPFRTDDWNEENE